MWSEDEDGEATAEDDGEGEAEPDAEPERCRVSAFSDGSEVLELER